MFKFMGEIFDYTVDEWQVAYAYYFFAAITGVLLAVILYLIVVAI